MSTTYGQFCAIARALDLLGDRWTLLVVRELAMGAERFSELQRGLPRISRSVLAQRLRTLEDGGVIERRDGPRYALTAAGAELVPVVLGLGRWGRRFLPRELRDDELDLEPLLRDVERRVSEDALPRERIVVALALEDVVARWYLFLQRKGSAACRENPGHPIDLVLHADRRALAAWWLGDASFEELVRSGRARVEGPRTLARAFPSFFLRYVLADAPAA